LDDGYVTTPPDIRFIFYGPNGTFDPIVLELDSLTEDVGSIWLQIQADTGNLNQPTPFKGPVTIMFGALDPACSPCEPGTLKVTEESFFIDADLNVVRIPGLPVYDVVLFN